MDELMGKVNRILGRNVQYEKLKKSIEGLVEMVEMLEVENGAMAEKHAEKDMAIRELVQIVSELKAENKRLFITVCHLKAKTTFKVYQENLELAEENARLRELVKI